MKKLCTALAFLLCISGLSIYGSDNAEMARLRQENQHLKNEATARAIADTVVGSVDYFTSLERRWKIPATKEQYDKKLEAAVKYEHETGDNSKLKEVVNDGWQDSWCKKNPFKCDCIVAGSVTAAVVGLCVVAARCSH